MDGRHEGDIIAQGGGSSFFLARARPKAVSCVRNIRIALRRMKYPFTIPEKMIVGRRKNPRPDAAEHAFMNINIEIREHRHGF
ncbi:MAG: hypothetical protein U0997_04510 [Sulfurimicrobium sp.]|nr:hypothetical protein [Sulfurimicrobium sp.]